MPYNLDSKNSRLVVVGAADPALHYIGNWGEDWENGPGDELWKSTTSSDSVSFQFHGTRILLDIVSTPNTTSSSPTIRWFIDNEAPVTASIQPSSSEWSFQSLIDRPGLSDGTHTINVTVVQVSADYPFLLDSFAFSPTSKFWSEALSTPDAGPNMAAIIASGICVGVVLALACMSFMVWLRRRRARRFLYSTISETQNVLDHQATPNISPFNLRAGARLGCTRSVASTVPHSPPPTTEISSTGATIVSQSQDSTDILEDSRVRQVPKRKGYQLRSSQHLHSLRAFVHRKASNQAIPTSSAPSTPPPQDASEVVAHPSTHGSEPPTPPPRYTA
ncbi:hypothetical protein LXA43DRAFT_536145 [Ganoderma leucocontextum]|nr:hypothetical protein LXA43DRAFT_536145 [Ganoderma leucocontextum]